jgi:hypothetical protein
MSFKLGS